MLRNWDRKKEAVIRRLPLLILIYCVLQPILDVAGYWQTKLELGNAVTMGIRMLLLAGSVLLGFLLSDRKRYYFITAAVLGVLTALHVVAIVPGGYKEPISDLVNLVRIYLMPLTVLCFITFLRQGGEEAFHAMKKGMMINILIIVAVEFLSVLTHTDRHTYENDQIGVMGWFYWSNCQSAILSMMAPIVICWALQRWPNKLIPIALFTVAAEITLFLFGTRLSFGSMAATGLGITVCLLVLDRRRWKQALVIFLITAVFVGLVPISPMAERMKSVDDNTMRNEAAIEQESVQLYVPETEPAVTELVTSPTGTVSADPQATEPRAEETTPKVKFNWRKYRKIYKNYLLGLVLRFDYARVIVKYKYTLDPAVLGNVRLAKISFCELLMEDAGPLNRLFGLNLMEMRVFMPNGFKNEGTDEWVDGYLIFDVENDFHGIYFLLGIVGLVLMCLFLLYFGLLCLYRIIRNFRTYFTIDMIGFAAAYVFGLLHAYFTVSVLRRNNASVYIALVLAGMWFLARKQKRPNEANGKTVS